MHRLVPVPDKCALPGCERVGNAEYFPGYCSGPHRWVHDREKEIIEELESRASLFDDAPMNSYAEGERIALLDVARDMREGDFVV